MRAFWNLLSRVRLVYRRSSGLLKCVVLTAIVLCTVCLLALRGSLMQTQARTQSLRQEAAALQQKNQRLESYIAELGTVESVKRIAREELGLVAPGTIFFLPND